MSEPTAFARLAFPVIGSSGVAVQERADRAEVRGHAAGYAAGLRSAEAETAALRTRLETDHIARLTALEARVADRVAALDAATAALVGRTAPVLEDAQDAMLDAAMDLAEAVVGYEIRASRQETAPTTGLEARAGSGAQATVARALASVDPTVVVTLRLSAVDAAALAGTDLPVSVTVDHTLAPGDAVAVLPDGIVDARIGTALDRARTALTTGGVA